MCIKSNEYKKALRFMHKLISKAEMERDTKGYRENLGYDSENKLDDFMGKLDLDYQQSCEIRTRFYVCCDAI